jgi:hypothetical protein
MSKLRNAIHCLRIGVAEGASLLGYLTRAECCAVSLYTYVTADRFE